MSVEECAKNVIGFNKKNDSFFAGVRETIKYLESGEAQIVFLANDCDNADYKNVINALAKQHNVYVNTSFDRSKLGELAGHYKIASSQWLVDEPTFGKATKCSSAVCTKVDSSIEQSLKLLKEN